MFKAWYLPFYKYGIIHGDPHLGNYSIRKDLGINLLDFGCIRVFKPSFVKGVIGLYNSDFTSLMLTIGYGWVEGRELVIDTFNSYYEITGADLIPNTGETLVFGSWDIPDDAITVIIPLD